MESELQIEYSHRLEGHYPVDDIDTAFYKTLPNVREVYQNPDDGRPALPIPSMDQILTVVGTTRLSSTSIASTIRRWLDGNQTRITISDVRGHHGISFEGTEPEETAALIRSRIDELVDKVNISQIRIRAVRL